MKTIESALVLAVSLLLVGCASAPPVPQETLTVIPVDANYSLAMRVAVATSLTDPVEGPLLDLPRSELPAELQNVPTYEAFGDVLDKGFYATGVLGYGSGLWGKTGGISRGGNLAFMALGLLTQTDALPHQALLPQVIAWMPAEGDVLDGEAAQAAAGRFRSLLETAAIATLPEGVSAEVHTTVHKPVFGPASETDRIFITGLEDCGSIDDKCILSADVRIPARAASPDGRDSWYWRNHFYGDKTNAVMPYAAVPSLTVRTGDIYHHERFLPLSGDREFARRISGHLPEWVYFYYPPTETEPPVMFNQGVEHYFVEPLAAQ